MNKDINPRYELSGNLGLATFIVPIGGILAIVVLSIVYAYVNVYSPIAGYISIAFVGSFAFAVGMAFSILAHVAKCRSIAYTKVFGSLAGFMAFYCSWAMFIQVLFTRDVEGFEASKFEVFSSPGFVWNSAKLLAEDGWYTIGSLTPSGFVLWGFWLIEALIIVGLGWLFSASSLEDEVFCESCGEWADDEEGFLRVELPEGSEALESIFPENIKLPVSLPPVEVKKASSLRFDRWQCTSCNELDVLRTSVIEYTRDGGEWEEDETQIGERAIVSKDIISFLKAHKTESVVEEES